MSRRTTGLSTLLGLLACLASFALLAACAHAQGPDAKQHAARQAGAMQRLDPAWEAPMSSGLGEAELGHWAAAADHFRSALIIARDVATERDLVAFSAYRLADAYLRHPNLEGAEQAEELLQEALLAFRDLYGAGHPVQMPVLLRVARLQSARGEHEAAALSRQTADRMAVQFFPEYHFLRDRFGAARPAALIHPLEVLQMLSPSSGDDSASDLVLESGSSDF